MGHNRQSDRDLSPHNHGSAHAREPPGRGPESDIRGRQRTSLDKLSIDVTFVHINGLGGLIHRAPMWALMAATSRFIPQSAQRAGIQEGSAPRHWLRMAGFAIQIGIW